MDGFNEHENERPAGYGDPEYRNRADYGKAPEYRNRADGGTAPETKKTRQGFLPENLPNPLPDNSEGRRRILFGVILAAAAVILAVVIISAISQIVRPPKDHGSSVILTESGEELMLHGEDSAMQASVPDGGEELQRSSGDPAVGDGLQEEPDSSMEQERLSVTEVVKKVMPSMVCITNLTAQEYRSFSGSRELREKASTGSGIIVKKTENELLIATNYHVIAGASDITVAFHDDTTAPAFVRGEDSDDDLAVIAVSTGDVFPETLEKVSAVMMGDSDRVEVGEPVVAIGNALGYGQSVSYGIISALGRMVRDADGTTRCLLQTDASINPGNSGGALINMRGELIGINEIKYVDTTVEGVGYAIPTATALPILERLQTYRERTKVSKENASYLGITCMTVPAHLILQGYPEGVLISAVTEGGPAEEAGIRAKDIITSLDGHAVKSQETLLEELSYYAAGDDLPVSVSRQGDDVFDKLNMTVHLGSRADAITSGLMNENGTPGANYQAAGEPEDGRAEESGLYEESVESRMDQDDYDIQDLFH